MARVSCISFTFSAVMKKFKPCHCFQQYDFWPLRAKRVRLSVPLWRTVFDAFTPKIREHRSGVLVVFKCSLDSQTLKFAESSAVRL
jgi:hypothetical protein